MNDAFFVAAVGMRAQQRALDVTAGNIANVNTPAYKRSSVRFSDVLALQADGEVPRADLDPAALTSASVSAMTAPTIDVSGEIKRTGNAMDVAIDGAGFIELMGPSGQTLLWRGGTMKVGEDGLLAAVNGLPLKAAITVPDDAGALTIGSDGIVRAMSGGNGEAIELGRIGLVKISDASVLEQLDGGLYRADDSARAIDAEAGEDGAGMLVQGGIEQSNVDMTVEMVDVMLVQRAYAANAQVVQAADQLMAIANGLRR